MIAFLKNLFAEPRFDPLIEGQYADQYPEEEGMGPRTVIRRAYRSRWPEPDQNPTPQSHPWLFDPCEPPQGWRYDPYYECWINTKD
jgi:hypothetical protein